MGQPQLLWATSWPVFILPPVFLVLFLPETLCMSLLKMRAVLLHSKLLQFISFVIKHGLNKWWNSRSVWVNWSPGMLWHLWPPVTVWKAGLRQCHPTAGASRAHCRASTESCLLSAEWRSYLHSWALNNFFLMLSWSFSSVKQEVGAPNV